MRRESGCAARAVQVGLSEERQKMHAVSLSHQLSQTPDASKEGGKREIVKLYLARDCSARIYFFMIPVSRR